MKLIKFPKGNHLRKKQKKLSNRRRWDPPQERVNGQDNYSPQNREIPALQCVNPFPPCKTRRILSAFAFTGFVSCSLPFSLKLIKRRQAHAVNAPNDLRYSKNQEAS